VASASLTTVAPTSSATVAPASSGNVTEPVEVAFLNTSHGVPSDFNQQIISEE